MSADFVAAATQRMKNIVPTLPPDAACKVVNMPRGQCVLELPVRVWDARLAAALGGRVYRIDRPDGGHTYAAVDLAAAARPYTHYAGVPVSLWTVVLATAAITCWWFT